MFKVYVNLGLLTENLSIDTAALVESSDLFGLLFYKVLTGTALEI